MALNPLQKKIPYIVKHTVSTVMWGGWIMHILMIAAGVLLAFLFLPILGLFGYILIAALVIGGIIFLIVTTVTGVQLIRESSQEAKKKAEERQKWLESLPEEQRAVEEAKDKKVEKIGRVIAYITIILGIIFIVLMILWAVAPELIFAFI